MTRISIFSGWGDASSITPERQLNPRTNSCSNSIITDKLSNHEGHCACMYRSKPSKVIQLPSSSFAEWFDFNQNRLACSHVRGWPVKSVWSILGNCLYGKITVEVFMRVGMHVQRLFDDENESRRVQDMKPTPILQEVQFNRYRSMLTRTTKGIQLPSSSIPEWFNNSMDSEGFQQSERLAGKF